jgi:penicillin amidase
MKTSKDYSTILIAVLILLHLALPTYTKQIPEPGKAPAATKWVVQMGDEEITIIRDHFGVPHIFAKSQRGAYYAGGYAVAQDRLFQLERYRRDARGQIAEIDGPSAFQRDVQMRNLRAPEPLLQAKFDSLKDDLKQSLQAYADGVNAYMQECISRNRIPAEFKTAGIIQPAPWKVTDTIAIGSMMSERFGTISASSPANMAILKLLKEKFGEQAEKMFDDLFWANDPQATTTIMSDHNNHKVKTRKVGLQSRLNLDDVSYDLLAEASRAIQLTDVIEYGQAHGLPTKWGSYSWAISPKRSASGYPILVGGPQMGFGTPQISHEIQYTAPGLNVSGMGIPGIPGVLIGHNDDVAWTMTTGGSDMKVIYAEQINPANADQYFHNGKYRDMEKRIEVFNIKGEKPREVAVRRTLHGPLVYVFRPAEDQARIAFSRATAYEGHEFDTFEAVYDFNHAKSISDFEKAGEKIYTNHNFIVASADGSIAYWHCGRPPLPISGVDPRLPVPGTGQYDKIQYRQFAEMPHVINPTEGFIMNWNTKPAKTWDNGDFPLWGSIEQGRRIVELIRSRDRMTFEQVRDITQDIATNDPPAVMLKPYLLRAIDQLGKTDQDERIARAGDLLRAWDDHAIDGSVAKTIFDAWLRQFREEAFSDEFGSIKSLGMAYRWLNIYENLVGNDFILHVLQGPRSALPPSRDYFNGKGQDAVIISSLRKALDKLASEYGPQMNLWTFSQGEKNLKPLPGIPNVARGTYIFAVELSKPLMRYVSILVPGQSEDPLSPYYDNQREMAGFWRFKPLLYSREQLEKSLAQDN